MIYFQGLENDKPRRELSLNVANMSFQENIENTWI